MKDRNTLGNRAVKSVATDIELAEILTPIDAIKKAVARKNAAARPPYLVLV